VPYGSDKKQGESRKDDVGTQSRAKSSTRGAVGAVRAADPARSSHRR
jgi:hypothetical protein